MNNVLFFLSLSVPSFTIIIVTYDLEAYEEEFGPVGSATSTGSAGMFSYIPGLPATSPYHLFQGRSQYSRMSRSPSLVHHAYGPGPGQHPPHQRRRQLEDDEDAL